MKAYDFTGQTELAVGQLVAVAKAAGTSTVMEIGVISRFTPKRVYYDTVNFYRATNSELSVESWTSLYHEVRHDRTTGKVKHYHSADRYAYLVVMEDGRDLNFVRDMMGNKRRNMKWVEGRA